MKDWKIAVIGVGYVGRPLLAALKKHFYAFGYDIDPNRSEIKETELSRFNAYIVCVPTPCDIKNNPDLQFIIKAADILSKYVKHGDLVVLESTVAPGTTRNIFGPRVACKREIMIGYSPERIDPGSKYELPENITKICAGDPKTIEAMGQVYSKVFKSLVYGSIESAEFAKLLENTQRDFNIALMNHCLDISWRMGVDFSEIWALAKTKWNFLPFKPGMVGGHCIPVDPHYLAKWAGSQLVEDIRQVNDYFIDTLSEKVAELISPMDNVLLWGYTYKDGCPDTRESGPLHLAGNLKDMGFSVTLFDPLVDNGEVPQGNYDMAIICRNHAQYSSMLYNHLESRGWRVISLVDDLPKDVRCDWSYFKSNFIAHTN